MLPEFQPGQQHVETDGVARDVVGHRLRFVQTDACGARVALQRLGTRNGAQHDALDPWHTGIPCAAQCRMRMGAHGHRVALMPRQDAVQEVVVAVIEVASGPQAAGHAAGIVACRIGLATRQSAPERLSQQQAVPKVHIATFCQRKTGLEQGQGLSRVGAHHAPMHGLHGKPCDAHGGGLLLARLGSGSQFQDEPPGNHVSPPPALIQQQLRCGVGTQRLTPTTFDDTLHLCRQRRQARVPGLAVHHAGEERDMGPLRDVFRQHQARVEHAAQLWNPAVERMKVAPLIDKALDDSREGADRTQRIMPFDEHRIGPLQRFSALGRSVHKLAQSHPAILPGLWPPLFETHAQPVLRAYPLFIGQKIGKDRGQAPNQIGQQILFQEQGGRFVFPSLRPQHAGNTASHRPDLLLAKRAQGILPQDIPEHRVHGIRHRIVATRDKTVAFHQFVEHGRHSGAGTQLLDQRLGDGGQARDFAQRGKHVPRHARDDFDGKIVKYGRDRRRLRRQPELIELQEDTRHPAASCPLQKIQGLRRHILMSASLRHDRQFVGTQCERPCIKACRLPLAAQHSQFGRRSPPAQHQGIATRRKPRQTRHEHIGQHRALPQCVHVVQDQECTVGQPWNHRIEESADTITRGG
ncbi:hypothetical protein GALL_416620 [mine drainage metagenome]|uniref:Uncharacterized protein n=1 Tax=mine drainage metagenome TaxID=410659 RepID=A0A1J5PZ16_9ZZZZ